MLKQLVRYKLVSIPKEEKASNKDGKRVRTVPISYPTGNGCKLLPLHLRQRLFCYHLRVKVSNLAHKLVAALEQVEEYPVTYRGNSLSSTTPVCVFDPLTGSTVQAAGTATGSAVNQLAVKMTIPVKLSSTPPVLKNFLN
ncbi:unnamed protein product [Sphagnum jensenii]|uniref:Uncharacterized protein n=1 Tax=Sphagnum jensenii TaxID=128206 RepID=A0ABP0VG05_9BRYO